MTLHFYKVATRLHRLHTTCSCPSYVVVAPQARVSCYQSPVNEPLTSYTPRHSLSFHLPILYPGVLHPPPRLPNTTLHTMTSSTPLHPQTTPDLKSPLVSSISSHSSSSTLNPNAPPVLSCRKCVGSPISIFLTFAPPLPSFPCQIPSSRSLFLLLPLIFVQILFQSPTFFFLSC